MDHSFAAIDIPGHKFPMPSKDGVRRHDGSDFLQCLATQQFSCDGQAAPLVIGKQDALLEKLLFKDLVFDLQILDDFLLMPVDPAGEDEDQQLPRL